MKTIVKIVIMTIAIITLAVSCVEDAIAPIDYNRIVVVNIQLVEGHEQAVLSWDKPTNGDPIGYTIYDNFGEVLVDLESNITSYTVNELEVGVENTLWIASKFEDGHYSYKVPVRLKTPDEFNFQTYPGSGLVFARWEAPDREDLTGYKLTWSPGGESGVFFDLDTFQYLITGLENDTDYTIALSATYDGELSPVKVHSVEIPGYVDPFVIGGEGTMNDQLITFTYNPVFVIPNEPVSWAWDFGDGTTATVENPEHTYTDIGKYTVRMVVIDDTGEIYEAEKELGIWGVKWTYEIGAEVRPQVPALADDGTIYICARNDNQFYAINPDGTLKWEYNEFTDYSYASASIGTDGTIYIANRDDNLHAINPDGSQKWIAPVGSNVNYSTPAIADDGTLYIGSDDDNLYAINPDGSQKWTFDTGHNVKSSPAIGLDGSIYFASDVDVFFALNPDGSEKWSVDIGGNSQACPAIDTDGTVIAVVGQGGTTGSVYAFNPDDGSVKWQTEILGRIEVSSPVIANGTIYVGTKDTYNLLAIDVSTGALLWSFPAGGTIDSSPAVDKNGVIYFGSADNYFYAINPDGTLKYKYLTGNKIWSGVSIGADGTVYIGAYDGKLYAFEMFAEGLADDTWPMRGKNNKHTSNVKD